MFCRFFCCILLLFGLSQQVMASGAEEEGNLPKRGKANGKRSRSKTQDQTKEGSTLKVRFKLRAVNHNLDDQKPVAVIEANVPVEETFPLLELCDDALIHVISFVEHHRDMAHLAIACQTLNNLIKAFPFAPAHFAEVMTVAVAPSFRDAIPISDFISEFQLDTIQGRADFYTRFTVQGFLDLVKGEAYKGYLLGAPYVAAKRTVQERLQAYRENGSVGQVTLANNFCIFPSAMIDLVYLETMLFERSACLALPRKIGALTNLHTVKVMLGHITVIPEGLGELMNLRTLDLSYNFIPCLPSSMSRLGALRTLNLEGNQLERFPDCLLALTGLTTLQIGRNRITSLPENIREMQGLQTLSLSNGTRLAKKRQGCLKKLPPEFGKLTALQNLDFSGHNLTGLPHSFSGLRSLKVLNLADNEIEEFPEPLVHLPQLENLDLSSNILMYIPEEVEDMTSLRRLNVRNTYVMDIPGNLEHMMQYILMDPLEDEEF